MRNTCLLLLCCVASLSLTYDKSTAQNISQEKFGLKQFVPTSPEAALLGRFGDIPVGYYTGTADVSVPSIYDKKRRSGNTDCAKLS